MKQLLFPFIKEKLPTITLKELEWLETPIDPPSPFPKVKVACPPHKRTPKRYKKLLL